MQGFSSKRSDNENNNSTSSFFCDPWETITYVVVVMSYAVFEFSSEFFGLRHQKYYNFNEQKKNQFENVNLDQFRQNINMDFKNWPIQQNFSKSTIQIFWWLETWISKNNSNAVCYNYDVLFAFANAISTTSRVYQIEFFQNSVFFIWDFFFRKKIIKRKKLCKTLFWKKYSEHSGIFSENLFQHIAKRWLSLTWLDLVFRPSAPYFIKNAYIQILSMHEKKKVKKKSIKTHHQYAEKNVPLCMLY